MGPSPSEGAELERRNSQESSNYRRPVEQQHQPSHHVQPSNPGEAGGLRARAVVVSGGGQRPALLCEGLCVPPRVPAPANGPVFPPTHSLPAAAAIVSVLRLQGARGTGLYAAQRSFWRGGEYSPRARSAHPNTAFPPVSGQGLLRCAGEGRF